MDTEMKYLSRNAGISCPILKSLKPAHCRTRQSDGGIWGNKTGPKDSRLYGDAKSGN